MKKVKIFFPKNKLSPKGGPSGYLYNLNNGLRHVNDQEVEISFYKNEENIEDKEGLRNFIPDRLKQLKRAYKFGNLLKFSSKIDEDLFEYDVIHFHKTEDLYFNRHLLDRFNGKVILTSHTPCAPYKELISRLNEKDYLKNKDKFDNLVEIDEFAFDRADYIIFPCEEAEEPYYNTWKGYDKCRKKEKYLYMPTGIIPCKANIDRNDFRKKWNIPENAFLISYAGRHNKIKGYDILKELGEKILSKSQNVYFIIAGKEGPLYKLENERWIEIGWTNDPHSMIAASDLFVLPNRETYFDLILLEVLSLGTPILMSKTGGNKYFRKFKSKGLLFYNTIDEAILEIESLLKESNDYLDAAKVSNLEIFNQNFTVDKFAENYIKILKKIVG